MTIFEFVSLEIEVVYFFVHMVRNHALTYDLNVCVDLDTSGSQNYLICVCVCD
jgi:hypothetical protein